MGPDSHKKFLRFMRNYEVGISKNKKFCPMPGCEAIILGKNNSTQMTCQACKTEICFMCQTEWHQGKSCSQAQKD